MTRATLFMVVCLGLTGCAGPTWQVRPAADRPETGAVGRCAAFFRDLDATVAEAGVGDAQAARVPGFPYLRVDRFLASFRDEVATPERFRAWVDRLLALDRRARRIELANLPAPRRQGLTTDGPPMERVRDCGTTLRRADLSDPENRDRLRRRAVVPDEYRTSWRIAGLYPLTAPLVRANIDAWMAELEAVFATPLADLPVEGRLHRYRPPRMVDLPPDAVARLVANAADNPLGIPEPEGDALHRVYAAFAPVFEVDTKGNADRIGRVVQRSDGPPRVETDTPVAYRRLSHTRLQGEVLLQLNYFVWFPARPKTGPLDLYGGHLDGLHVRITLGPDGTPWMVEAVHNCGCYHLFFPAGPLRLRRDLPNHPWFEPPRVPQRAPRMDSETRMVVRMAERTHMVQRLYTDEARDGHPYEWRPYAALRALPLADGGHASLFDPNGLIPSSRRLESLLLWPMGIPLPGGMRQWGHHAIAFVGQRHLDEPNLLERLFEVR